MLGQKLKAALKEAGYSQTRTALATGVSEATISQLLCHGIWPRRTPGELRDKLRQLLLQHISEPEILEAFKEIDSGPIREQEEEKEEFFMIRKQALSPEARKQFRIFRDIFSDFLNDPDDIFFSPYLKYLDEVLYQTARGGGLLALVGESGSGKSTLRKHLLHRLETSDSNVMVIEPYVISMDDDSKAKSTLRPNHICEAVIAVVDPGAKKGGSPEARFKLMHDALAASHKINNRHCLIIEEAHSMPIPTIRALKRFYELESGMSRLLSIILIGQRELKNKLSEKNASVREVVQRTELLEIPPLEDVEGYVRHRCKRSEADFERIFAKDAMAELRMKLTGPSSKQGKPGSSLLYPLLVGNVLAKAVNLAAEMGLQQVNADVIRAVK
ncbi:AAA family ATPase [Desulfovibrio sp. OttesenSCG-928-C14]|nr:AAA family ATPase [Desulfovibrio sp. OttesenSCG-928-C14]